LDITVRLQDEVQNYLCDTLGIRAPVQPWVGTTKLPYYLQDEFELYELKAKDHAILLAVNRKRIAPKIGALRERLDNLRSQTDRPIVYVTAALASYERKRLIENKIPFIVPGNQLYLPDLGIDLREYFRQIGRASERSLSPATQAMIIKALLSKSTQNAWHPAAMASELGYTAMTVSRVVNELTGTGIATLDRRGRVRWLLMERSPAETWEMIRPKLRSPVKSQFWVQVGGAIDEMRLPLAGLSALAHYTKLADPPQPVYAANSAQFKAARFKKHPETPEPSPGSCQLQLWSYAPIIQMGHKIRTVDTLSLSLSLQDTADDRVELALEELKEHFPW
jgi:hypothetical protein